MARTVAASGTGRPPRRSSSTKSLPAPCILLHRKAIGLGSGAGVRLALRSNQIALVAAAGDAQQGGRDGQEEEGGTEGLHGASIFRRACRWTPSPGALPSASVDRSGPPKEYTMPRMPSTLLALALALVFSAPVCAQQVVTSKGVRTLTRTEGFKAEIEYRQAERVATDIALEVLQDIANAERARGSASGQATSITDQNKKANADY